MTDIAVTVPIPNAAPEPFAGVDLSPAHIRLLLLGLSLATGMEFYTFDSMNLVLADLTGTLGVSGDEASWLLTVYSCALFLGVPVSIWMAGHYGYKRFLIATIILFALASMGCAVSPDLGSMLVWRAVQGLAGAGLVVWWRASIYLLHAQAAAQSFADAGLDRAVFVECRRPSCQRLYHRPLQLAPDLPAEPALRGRCGVAAGPLLSRPCRRPASERLVETDWLGIALLATALISLQIILNRGEIDDWFGSPRIRLLTWTSAGAFLLFVMWQGSPRNRTPLLWLALLRDRNVMSSALIGIFTGMILSGSLFVLPEFLRNISDQTHSATQTGQIMCVYALTAAAIRPLMVGLIARLGQRKTIALALVMLIASMVLLNRLLTTQTPDFYYLLPLILYAFCLSPLLPAVGSGTVARIEQNKLLDGVSLYMTFRQFGASLGVALLTILIERRETLHSSRLFEHLRRGNPVTQDWLASGAAVMTSRGGYSSFEGSRMATKLLAEAAGHQAATLSYADAFAFMAMIGLVALCLVPIIPPTPVAKK